MSTINLFRNAAKNPATTILYVIITIVMAGLIVGDILDMRAATSGYDYCQNLCYLFENICIAYFLTILSIMYYLTYINKQYSKWSIWLFYVLGVSVLVKFAIAGFLFKYVYHHVESEFIDKLPSLASTLFEGGIIWIVSVFFFVPKFIKDTMKLKEEMVLTV